MKTEIIDGMNTLVEVTNEDLSNGSIEVSAEIHKISPDAFLKCIKVAKITFLNSEISPEELSSIKLNSIFTTIKDSENNIVHLHICLNKRISNRNLNGPDGFLENELAALTDLSSLKTISIQFIENQQELITLPTPITELSKLVKILKKQSGIIYRLTELWEHNLKTKEQNTDFFNALRRLAYVSKKNYTDQEFKALTQIKKQYNEMVNTQVRVNQKQNA